MRQFLAAVYLMMVFCEAVEARAAKNFSPSEILGLQAPEQTLTCRHLRHRYKIQMDTAHSMEAVMTKYSDFMEQTGSSSTQAEDYYQNVIDAMDYFENRNGFQFDSIAGQNALKVNWDISVNEIKAHIGFSPQILGVVAAARHTATDLNYRFQSADLKLLRQVDKWTLTANVRPLDVCLAEKLDLFFYAGCEIDNTQFDGCLPGDHCPVVQPQVLWMSCRQQASLSLSLIEAQGILGQRQGGWKRGGLR